MTDETTPDALEMLSALLGEMLDGLVVPPTEAIERRERLYQARNALLAERQRHAEEVARLEAEAEDLCDVTASLRDQLHQATELVSVLEERLDAFEDTEPDARACAEWVIDITQDGDTRQAARRYLSGVANRTATRLHRDAETLRDQLRKVEGERDALAVRMDLPASQLLMVGSELCGDGKIDPNDHRDPRWTPTLQQAAKVMRELTSLRSLLPDVRLIAESAMYETTGGESLTPAARAARRILAALDSQGGEEPSLPGEPPNGNAGPARKDKSCSK